MKLEQFYHVKLMEECAEVAQRASKLIQFGPDEVEPGQELTNRKRLQDEIFDLICMVRFCDMDIILPSQIYQKKKDKVEKYMAYSIEIGALEIEELKL